MFSRPESASLSDAYVAVRMLAGNDLTPEGEAFVARHDIQRFPTLMAMTRDGSVVDDDLLGGQIRDVASLLERLGEAAETEKAFVAEREAALAAGDAASLEALAASVLERAQPERAAALLEQAVEAGAGRDALVRLADLRHDVADVKGEQEALDRLLAEFPDDPEAPAWRIRRATAHLPSEASAEDADAVAAQHLEALEALRETMGAEGDANAEAHVRFRLAELLTAQRRSKDAEAHLTWIVEHAPGSRPGRTTCILLARRALRKADLKAATRYAETVLDAAPTSPQAVDAHVLLGDLAYAQGDPATYLEHLKALVREFPGTVAAERAAETIPSIEAEVAGN